MIYLSFRSANSRKDDAMVGTGGTVWGILRHTTPSHQKGATKMFAFDPAKVTYDLNACMDMTTVRGNAMASGDEAIDTAAENEILQRLKDDDIWAWAFVVVTATYEGVPRLIYGEDSLGACTYDDEADFKQPGGYYDDMCTNAREELRQQLEALAKSLA